MTALSSKLIGSLLWVCLCLCSEVFATELSPDISYLPISDNRKDTKFTKDFTLTIDAQDVQGLLSQINSLWRSQATLTKDGQRVELRYRGYPKVIVNEPTQLLQSTFLVDFDSKPYKQHLNSEPPITIEEVPKRVYSVLGNKPDSSINPASQILKRGTGDCKNHAILSAAMLRSIEIPTRIVGGFVLTRENNRVKAIGHMWNEYASGGVWQRLDSTLYALQQQSREAVYTYVPLYVIENESVSYNLEVLKMMRLTPKHVALSD